MRYIKLSLKYLIKNILFLFLLSLIPAIFMGSLLSPFKFLEFINNYASISVISFNDIFYSLIDISWLSILLYLIGFALLIVSGSFVIGVIENHFRSGKKDYFGFKNYINNNMTAVLFNIMAYTIIKFICLFVCGTLIYLFHILFAGLNTTPNIICLILAIVLLTLYSVVMIMISLVLMINIPNMLYNGYNFKQGIINTINLVSKNYLNLILAVLVPFLIIIPLIAIFNFSIIAIKIINVIGLIICFIYYESFIMTAYYDLTNLPRYDERKYYNIK